MDQKLSEHITGTKKPRSFLLDSSVIDQEEAYAVLSDCVKEEAVEFSFPEGFAVVPLVDECRALTRLDDFDTIYDLTMLKLTGKPVEIRFKHPDGTKQKLCEFQVTNPQQDLRGVEVINDYPILITWLTEFIAGDLRKQFPMAGRNLDPPSSASETGTGRMKRKKTTE
jgi:hypothetical protein